MSTKLSDDDIRLAWEEIAKHPMWRRARLKLLRMLLDGIPGGMEDRALRETVGRQSLARELLDMTDSISEENDDRTDERTYLVRPQPVANPGRGTIRRRIAGSGG